jgi:hypothetical protein
MKLLIMDGKGGEKALRRDDVEIFTACDNILSSIQFYNREKFFPSPWKLINMESSLNCNFSIIPSFNCFQIGNDCFQAKSSA